MGLYPGDRKRICIVTPGTIGSNPRSFKQAQALCDAGYEVTVIATRLAGKLDLADSGGLAWRMKYVDLRPRIRWYSIRATQLATERFSRAIGSPRLMRLVASPFVAPLLQMCLREKADLYMAHYPPSLPAVANAAYRYKGAFSYDAEDFHLGELPESAAYDDQRERIRCLEEFYLPKSSFVTAASPLIGAAVAKSYAIAAPSCILNCFPKSQAPVNATPRGRADLRPSIYWFSQTVGPNRGLEEVVFSISQSKTRPNLYLRGIVADGFADKLFEIAENGGLAREQICLLPPAPAAEMERLSANYDLGLCVETGYTPNSRYLLSNKLFSFMLAGLPPLMSDTPAQAKFAEEAGLTELLFPRNDTRALAALIDNILLNPDRLAQLRQTVWNLGQGRYNWEIEKSKFLGLVADAFDRPANRPAKN